MIRTHFLCRPCMSQLSWQRVLPEDLAPQGEAACRSWGAEGPSGEQWRAPPVTQRPRPEQCQASLPRDDPPAPRCFLSVFAAPSVWQLPPLPLSRSELSAAGRAQKLPSGPWAELITVLSWTGCGRRLPPVAPSRCTSDPTQGTGKRRRVAMQEKRWPGGRCAEPGGVLCSMPGFL